MMTDRPTLTRAFEDAGLSSEASEHIATQIYDAIHDNVATKADLRTLEQATRADLVALEQRLKLWLGSLVIAAAGGLFAALHQWPPHG